MSVTTIWNILNNDVEGLSIKRGIEIPMIQRDYAQGRINNKANEIRKVFLDKIISSIISVKQENSLPLELDFIYGYIESEIFVPLDGQQRLTTLYLIYWYFAFKEEKLVEYKNSFLKFNYQTRQSSEDFLKCINNSLTQEDYLKIFKKDKTFKEVITDKNWYFVNWKYDITIQSAITMLDEIHSAFRNSNIVFSDFINPDKPCIVFNFLDIKNFGLSDDLYIKMNSRGKPLTNFENLKAELGKFIELSDFNHNHNYYLKHSSGVKSVDVETYFVTKIDTDWSDYFWNIRNDETNEYDDKLLNLLAFISLNETAKESSIKFDNCLESFDIEGTEMSYYRFKQAELLTEKSIITYINVLDLLVSKDSVLLDYFMDDDYLDKKAIITSSYENNYKGRYEQRVLFYAIFRFLLKNSDSLILTELKKWDRLIRNLVSNTIYNRPKDFQESLIAIDEILAIYSGDIYNDFLNADIKGFDGLQIREEKLKIELLLKNNGWETIINDSEQHKYLNGQISFLFVFSGVYDKYLENNLNWDPNINQHFVELTNEYFLKFIGLFKDSGLREFEDEIFRRALLSKGDYRLHSTNYSLLIDKDRDLSWKRLLREAANKSSDFFQSKLAIIKSLFDDLDRNDLEKSLRLIIQNHSANDWRKDFIENPIIISKSYRKYFKFFDNNDIYILRKSKYNKYADPEIKSLLLKERMLKNGFADKDIELGYIDSLNQYGIIRIKNIKPKVIYNLNGNGLYLIKQKGKEDVFFQNESKTLKYLVENF
jgi:hypothetical protein